MAAPFDVAARLADGLPAVLDAQTYVWACHLRGYQSPDLTSHGAQVGEWYGSEDGLDLGALDADCAALSAATKTLGEALRLARAQVADLPQTWTGPGAAAAADFLRRHCDSAAALVEAVANAAQSAATLRDELWRVVDHKVEVTAAIEDRTQGQRGSWLTAARAVLAGDSAAQGSAQVLDDQVKPFVDNEIGGHWVPEMRAAAAAARDAYRVALSALVAGPGARFDIPGDLGPSYDGPVSRAPLPVPPPAQVASSPAMAPPSTPPNTLDPLVSPASAPAPIPPADASAPLAPTAAVPTPATPAGVMPGLGSLGEIPARLADALGGLLSPSAGPQPDSLADLAEPAEIDIPEADQDPAAEDSADEDPADEDLADEDLADEGPAAEDPPDEDPADEDVDAEAPETDEVAESEGDCPEGCAEEPQSPPAPPPAPLAAPAAEPTPEPAPPSTDGATPCEIAADELPQAGQ